MSYSNDKLEDDNDTVSDIKDDVMTVEILTAMMMANGLLMADMKICDYWNTDKIICDDDVSEVSYVTNKLKGHCDHVENGLMVVVAV